MRFSPGEQVTPTLRLVKLLGQGGMGSVWAARHAGLDLDVAVKFIASELVKADDPLVVERFKREAQLAARIDSPHVVRTFDHGMTSEGVPYIVMELLRGESLYDRLVRKRRLTPAESATIVAEVAKGLERAHTLGIVHRDIKPHNVFLADGPDGEIVKLLDFGVAKARTNETQSVATSSGVLIGTPQYMSPEQLMRAGPVDPSVDLWALSVLAYEMVTGKLPFRGETLAATLVAITRADVETPSSSNPAIPLALDAWFLRALAIDPDKRFKTARELSRALDAAIEGTAPTSDGVVIARTGNVDIGAIQESAGTGEFMALRGLDVPRSVRGTELGLAATETERKPIATPVEHATLPSAVAGPVDRGTAAGVELSKARAVAVETIEEGPETRFRRSWTPRRLVVVGAAVLAVGAGAGVLAMTLKNRQPPPPPQLAVTPSATEAPTETVVPSATTETSAVPPPHVASIHTIEKTAVDQGYAPLSRVWLPQYSFLREDGDQDRSLLDAEAACQAKAMALCTESQWTRACAVNPDLATLSSWTSTLTEKGSVVRGGAAGDGPPSCTSRDVVAPDTHDAHRIGVCCSRAVGISSQIESAAFLQTTSRKLLEFENAFNAADVHGIALLVDDPMILFVRSQTRDQVADYFGWKAREGQFHVHDVCEVQMVKRDDGDGWAGDCVVASLGRGGVVRDTRRYTRGGPKGLILEILEPKPAIVIVTKG